ncbi:HEAT repeat domain-containing protein [Ectothiorhodospira shaposhnikovii]|uniref:HEAT repeat domain-containing protein n=1 Tax=Ectothiorhodospira shaposhnikovii TaxID=1054 RepID=UPI001EE8CFA8|nr:HEAT repeat domain-containing protein [Ectothiorhodospira shaposhnikovii]MCG5511885.1 HEAT repeat domain-containing protein [Ectothiorhodospira shaposhnikovii]
MALKKGQPTPPCHSPGERQEPRNLETLLQTLLDEDVMKRRWAARDLAEHPAAAEALVTRLRHEKDATVLQVIVTSLGCIANEVAICGLIDCLYSEHTLLRNAAIEVLKELPEPVAPHMGKLLHDPDPDVRIFAVNVLESLRHPQVEAWLLEVILKDEHINVCATAVDLLGEVGSPQSRDALRALKQRFPEEPYIQFAADLALKRIGAG